MQKGFFIELDRCTGCRACQVACKTQNQVEVGPLWRRVTEIESGKYPSVAITNLSLSCMHCAKPACAAVCPTGAISKRSEDGIVVVDQTKCIGCRYCAFACPFGAPQFGSSGLMQKCDLCLERTAQGKDPACVATCTTKALHSGTMEELAKLSSDKTARSLVGATQPSVFIVGGK